MSMEILDPTTAAATQVIAYAPRPAALAGKRVALIENTKFNSDTLLQRIGDILKAEYGVPVLYDSLPYSHARWVFGDKFDPSLFEQKAYGRVKCLVDVEGRPLVLFGDQWAMARTTEVHPELAFIAAVQPGRTSRA